jgi:hypothetical protein
MYIYCTESHKHIRFTLKQRNLYKNIPITLPWNLWNSEGISANTAWAWICHYRKNPFHDFINKSVQFALLPYFCSASPSWRDSSPKGQVQAVGRTEEHFLSNFQFSWYQGHSVRVSVIMSKNVVFWLGGFSWITCCSFWSIWTYQTALSVFFLSWKSINIRPSVLWDSPVEGMVLSFQQKLNLILLCHDSIGCDILNNNYLFCTEDISEHCLDFGFCRIL